MLKRIIKIPEVLQVQVEPNILKLSNKNESIKILLPKMLVITKNKSFLNIEFIDKSIINTINSKILQSIKGLTVGFKEILSLHGIGYKVLKGVDSRTLTLKMGFSHSITQPILNGVRVRILKNDVIISGSSQEKVSQFSANLKLLRKQNVYRLKGFRIKGKDFNKKEGKKK